MKQVVTTDGPSDVLDTVYTHKNGRRYAGHSQPEIHPGRLVRYRVKLCGADILSLPSLGSFDHVEGNALAFL